ncbi:nucleotide exchange factor GrpE [Aerococcus sanguinicola]|uniref:nucleotide exchange factor GrpE n=1 Tax=Aerococcus sanguinicola TaxID=119206 RepID=UPI0018A71C51|nr:nucleotide exchange factor GrpE [Aerococcus sanguinicola]
MSDQEKDFETKEEKEKVSNEEVDEQTETNEENIEKEESQADPVAELEDKIAQKDDQILRLSAEIKNIQRRNANERQDAAKYRSQSLAQAILPSLDNLERALAIEADDEASNNLKKGVEMVHQSLLEALKAEGDEVIDPVGEAFDPNFHQSVSSVPAEEGQEAEEIVEVYQKGYVLKDRVLRPAMVIIAQ